MCCTCGTAESDLDSCGRSSAYKVSPTTGKGAGLTDVDGLCGRSCSGVETVDSVGVYEFDTESESVVATHLLAEGIGGEPYASHDGSKSPNVQGKNSTAVLFGIFSPRQIYSEYIVLLGKNGGSTVRVLEVGYRSVVRCCYFLSVFLTYHLGSFIPHVICKLVRHYFPNRSTERPASQACHPLWSLISSWTSREIAIDTIILALPAISPLLKYSARLTWHSLQVRHSNRSSILPPRAVARALTTSLAKGTSHTIAIVDFDNFNVRHVTLTEADFENTAPHGRYRGVEWAVGTPYGEYPFASVLR